MIQVKAIGQTQLGQAMVSHCHRLRLFVSIDHQMKNEESTQLSKFNLLLNQDFVSNECKFPKCITSSSLRGHKAESQHSRLRDWTGWKTEHGGKDDEEHTAPGLPLQVQDGDR